MSESSDLGFPEFESIHLQDFSCKAQLSKSVASTIPPRPLIAWTTIARDYDKFASQFRVIEILAESPVLVWIIYGLMGRACSLSGIGAHKSRAMSSIS